MKGKLILVLVSIAMVVMLNWLVNALVTVSAPRAHLSQGSAVELEPPTPPSPPAAVPESEPVAEPVAAPAPTLEPLAAAPEPQPPLPPAAPPVPEPPAPPLEMPEAQSFVGMDPEPAVTAILPEPEPRKPAPDKVPEPVPATMPAPLEAASPEMAPQPVTEAAPEPAPVAEPEPAPPLSDEPADSVADMSGAPPASAESGAASALTITGPAEESLSLFSGDALAEDSTALPPVPESPFVLMEDVANAALPKPRGTRTQPAEEGKLAVPAHKPVPLSEEEERADAARLQALRDSPSPFIRMFAEQPGRWRVWGPEVIKQARREKKVIYLCVGFASCHWSQLMARESLADPLIAEILDENFICAVADRHQRPDLDSLYLNLMQNLSGNAGWPLNLWLTGELQPFFGCSYLPLKSTRDQPGFAEVLSGLLETLARESFAVEEHAKTVEAALKQQQTIRRPAVAYTPDPGRPLQTQAAAAFAQEYDFANGGFGNVPKFPEALALRLLLRHSVASGDPLVRDLATGTLERIAGSALRDHLDGGIHRFSMSADWNTPRFEKMLVDNVLLAEAALDAFRATGKPLHAGLARECLDFVRRDLALPQGGFGASLNSESPRGEQLHVDGGYYTWRAESIDVALGKEAGPRFREAYHLPLGGNLPDDERGVLYSGNTQLLNPPEWETDLATLRGLRAHRDKPLPDTQAVCGLNALAASAFIRAGAILGDPDYATLGKETLAKILEDYAKPGAGAELHRLAYRDKPMGDAFLDDYAAAALACLDQAEVSFDPVWTAHAVKLAGTIREKFWSEELGVFYHTADQPADLPVRPVELQDAAAPSGSSLATRLFARLGLLLENAEFRRIAGVSLATATGQLGDTMASAPELLRAEPLLAENAPLILVIGNADDDATSVLLTQVHAALLPETPLMLAEPGAKGPLTPLIQTRLGAENPLEGMPPTVFITRGNRCGPPLRTPAEVSAALEQITPRPAPKP